MHIRVRITVSEGTEDRYGPNTLSIDLAETVIAPPKPAYGEPGHDEPQPRLPWTEGETTLEQIVSAALTKARDSLRKLRDHDLERVQREQDAKDAESISAL